MAVKWSLFYANWYQPPWTDPKICPHSRTLRKFGKNHISPHGQTPLKFGKPHESLVTHNLLGQDENTTCGATRLDAYRARLIAYHHTQLFVYGGVTPSYLLSHVLRHMVVCVSACPQESIPVHGTYCNPTACSSL